MAPITAVALGSLLVALFIGAVAVMALQEARTRREEAQPTYIVLDAVAFAMADMDEAVVTRLRKAGVQRVIEWSVHYLQGLATPMSRRRGVTVVAGGEGNAIEYIGAQLARRGFEYSAEDIEAVLTAEGRYLASIGALGAPADETEIA